MGALLLALVAAMTPFVAGPDLAYAQSQSTETTLYELSFAEQSGTVTVSAFMPAFVPDGAPDAGGYSAYATTGTTTVALTANASHTAASVEVTAGADEESASATSVSGTASPYTVTLEDAGEDTVILVKVTAPDNIETETYKLTVKRAAADDDDVTLSALSLMAGGEDVTLTPEFAATTGATAYDGAARVPYTTASVTVTATPGDEDDGATYAVTSTNADGDDNAVQNGVVSLSEGENTITVKVTAADRVTTLDHTVTVTRVEDTVSTDTTLTTLSLTDGTNAVSLSPAFRAGTAPASNGYTARVAHGIGSVALTATKSHVNATVAVTAGPTDSDDDQTTVGDLTSLSLQAEGTDTVILVTVTAEDNASKATYKVTVERAADPASTTVTLAALSLMAGGSELTIADNSAADDFMPGDCATAGTCSARVPNSIGQVTVMATPVNRGATYEVESDNDSNVQNNRVDLDEGANVITVTVTAADGTAEGEYTVTVTRAASTDSRVTTLATLSLTESGNAVSLMPTFDPDGAPASGGYMAYVANTVATVDVAATASHTGATVEVRSGADEEEAMGATPAASVTLEAAGEETIILVTVTGADMFASATYKITVMRGATGTDVITLSALSLMDAGGNEITIADGDNIATDDFDVASCLTTAIATTPCTASVPNATTSVTVTAEPTDEDDGATYAVTKGTSTRALMGGVVDLDEGANAIKVTVTGADKVSKGDAGTYTVTVTRVASNLSTDTTLSVLRLDDDTANDDEDPLELEPEFVANSEPVEGGYATEIAADITSVLVTATTAHTGANIEVRAGADEASAMEADVIGTNSGTTDQYTVTEALGLQGQGTDTVILVTVTAADFATTGTHMITVSREATNDNSELKSLSLNGDAVTLPATAPADGIHAREIVDVPSVTVMATPRNSMATVVVTSNEDSEVEDNVVDLAVGINVITVKVTAAAGPATATTDDDCLTGTPDANIDCYTIRVRRDLSDDASLSMLSLKHLPMNKMEGESIALMPMFDSGTMSYSADAGSAEMITVTAKAMHAEAMVSVTVNGNMAMMTDIPMYWDMLGCPAMNDSVRMYDDHSHPDSPDSPYCTTYHMDDLGHPGLMGDAKDIVDMTFADYYDVPLMMGSNTISVMVTAEDGTTSETYTVTVSVAATSDEARLLAEYDTNGVAGIQAEELRTAIQDYLAEELSPTDMRTLIQLYLNG